MVRFSVILLLILMVMITASSAKVLTVSQNGTGMYSSVQDAVDAAGDGDVIKILDSAIYKEQVTISKKKNLTLTSSNPESISKPTVCHQDTTNVGPATCDEAKIPEKITFSRNGALRIIDSYNVNIAGITVDGGGVFFYGAPDVWDDVFPCRYPIQSGNSGIVIFNSGRITVQDCEIVKSYFGLYLMDSNDGGIFACLDSQCVDGSDSKLSSFLKSGNNLIQRNTIHDNSFGLYFENNWDLGTVVRYNVIYKNYQLDTIVNAIKKLTDEGDNQIGGALFFKNAQCSPLAIYNNTFWRNSFTSVGHWRCGNQYLYFNNIYARPDKYWSKTAWTSTWMVIDPVFVNRVFSSTYASQSDSAALLRAYVSILDSTTNKKYYGYYNLYQPRIMNGLDQIQRTPLIVPVLIDSNTFVNCTTNVIKPGNLIDVLTSNWGFPAANMVRWFEPIFKSEDPSNKDFLVPDWTDTLNRKILFDNGWASAGIHDNDGSPADLGAKPDGGINKTIFTVDPLSPVKLTGNEAQLVFNLSSNVSVVSPVVRFARFVDVNPIGSNVMGDNTRPIALNNINSINISPVQMGLNKITVSLPQNAERKYSFVEMVVEAKDMNGKPVYAVGGIPYRDAAYRLEVEIRDLNDDTVLTEVPMEKPVLLKVKPVVSDTGLKLPDSIRAFFAFLHSPYELSRSYDKSKVYHFDANGAIYDTIQFAKRPAGSYDVVNVRASFQDTSGKSKVIWGFSDPVFVEGVSVNTRFKSNRPKNMLNGNNLSCEVYDLRGRCVAKIKNTKNYTVDSPLFFKKAGISGGMYIVRVIDLNTGKMVYYRNLNFGR